MKDKVPENSFYQVIGRKKDLEGEGYLRNNQRESRLAQTALGRVPMLSANAVELLFSSLATTTHPPRRSEPPSGVNTSAFHFETGGRHWHGCYMTTCPGLGVGGLSLVSVHLPKK